MLTRLAQILACPQCRGALTRGQSDRNSLHCAQCGAEHRRAGRCFDLGGLADKREQRDWLNRIKSRAKRKLGRFYPLAIRLLSPVHARAFLPRFLKTFDLDRQLVLDLGSGTNQYRDQVVCVDGFAYDNVHLVCDLEKLPLQSNSVDGLISIAVLEHTHQPSGHVAEMKRVLKPGGRVLCYVPFIQGYHASPDDYQRFTIRGARELFEDFQIIDVQVGAGPMSGLLWIVQEWLAVALSFGSLRLYRLLVPVMWLLSPLKYFDLLLARHPAASVIASGFVVEARKPESQ